jgi:hypothetical protein
MVQEQVRRKAKKRFLDASLIPLEKALEERARAIENFDENMAVVTDGSTTDITYQARQFVADQFRALAEELYYW